MKKYILVSFAVLILGLLIIPNLSFAQIPDPDPNPTGSDCVALQSSNLRYRARDANTNGEVSTLQDFLQTKGYLNSEPTGYFGLLTVKAVKDFQKANNISPTGYLGSVTRAKIKDLTCGGIVGDDKDVHGCIGSAGYSWCQVKNKCLRIWEEKCVASSNDPVISSVSGPQSLTVGQTGTWTVNASSSNSGTLSYSVDWGDVVNTGTGTRSFQPTATQSPQQSATFTHTYSTAGTYTPTFTVTNSNGESAKTSLSVKVGDTITTPSITVLSPNGGENLKEGDVVRITWKTTNLPSSQKLDIALEVPHLTWQQGTVGKNIITGIDNRGYYDWTVKSLQPFYEPEGGTTVYPNGQYKINVSCRYGDGGCPESNNFDESNNYFTITSSTLTDDLGCPPGQNYSSKSGKLCTDLGCYGEKYSRTSGQMCYGNTTPTTPTISSVSGPQSLNVNQQGTWTVSASDNSNPGASSNLTYSVNWGDAGIVTCPTSAACTTATQSPQQTGTFTHTYSTAGTYNPTFTVTNTSGQSAKTSLSVVVKNLISTNHNPVLGTSTAPSTIYVNQSANFGFSATDADNDDLSWSIDWGDSSGGGSACSLLQGGQDSCQGQNGSGWTFNMSHTWNIAGTYNVKVTVSDSKGGSASSSFSINVSTSVTCASTTDVVEAALGNPGGTGPFEKLGLDISTHPEILKYRIQWSNGGWSDWYVPGVNDQDSKNNLDGTARRIWSYFDDHTHEYIKCLTSTSGGGDGSSGSSIRSGTSTTTTRSGIVSFVPESSLSANALGALNSATSNEKNSQTNLNTSVSSSCKFTMTLSKGMNNSEVKCLQQMLIKKGFKINGVNAGEETTYFGYATLTALKEFQIANQLSADGIFGSASRIALQK